MQLALASHGWWAGQPCPSHGGGWLGDWFTAPAAEELNSLRAFFACITVERIFRGALAAAAVPAQIFGLCRHKHLFGEDFVRVQEEVYCLPLQSTI